MISSRKSILFIALLVLFPSIACAGIQSFTSPGSSKNHWKQTSNNQAIANWTEHSGYNPFSYMDHTEAFEWGIKTSIAQGEQITSASLTISNLTESSMDNYTLWLNLLGNPSTSTAQLNSQLGSRLNESDYYAGNGGIINYYDSDPYTTTNGLKNLSSVDNYWQDENDSGSGMLLHRLDHTIGDGSAPVNYVHNFSANELTFLTAAINDGVFAFGIDSDCHLSMSQINFQYTTDVNAVPEPATMLLFALGLTGLAGSRRYKKRNLN